MINERLKEVLKGVADSFSIPRLRYLEKRNRSVADLIKIIKKEELTYLSLEALIDLTEEIIRIETEKIPGMVLEAGCARGGSSIVIAGAKNKERKFNIYDVFGMIPPPSEKDGKDVIKRYEVIKSGKSHGIKEKIYYGYEENLYDKVTKTINDYGFNLNENNISLVKGLYASTLKINEPVAFAHIDCDWYESVFTCLSEIEPKLVSGGSLIVDDYFHWSGCRKAVDDYFRSRNKDNYQFTKKITFKVIKN